MLPSMDQSIDQSINQYGAVRACVRACAARLPMYLRRSRFLQYVSRYLYIRIPALHTAAPAKPRGKAVLRIREGVAWVAGD